MSVGRSSLAMKLFRISLGIQQSFTNNSISIETPVEYIDYVCKKSSIEDSDADNIMKKKISIFHKKVILSHT